MAILEVLTFPDARLKQPAIPVEQFDDKLQRFIVELEATRLAGPAAVGIAATQVGRAQRILIVDVSKARKPVPNHGHLVLINPEITYWEGYEVGREGCLSVPEYTGNVIRANRIVVKALDPMARALELEMTGYEARVMQHELDHLEGILFIDRVVSRRTDLFQRIKKQST